MKIRLQDNLHNLLTSQRRFSYQNLERFKDIPFYCEWEYGRKLDTQTCCFTHIIGLPKDAVTGEPRPLYQWQKELIIDNLEQHKLNWLKKATGIGASELTLRWIIYQCLTNKQWQDGIVCILTGPNWDLAKRLINRAYNMISQYIPLKKVTDTKLILNNIEISSFPSHNLGGMRSLTNVRFILLDEADYFGTITQQNEVEIVVSRYVGKSDCSIFMVSTPNSPEGLFSRIEANDTNYHKTFIDWTIPYGTLFTEDMIAKAKLLPSWQREYCNQYTGLEGNVFNFEDLQAAQQEDYSLRPEDIETPYNFHVMGIDTGFSSSKFAVTITMVKDNMLYVVYSQEFDHIGWSESIDLCRRLIGRFHVQKCYVDGSNHAFCSELMTSYDPSLVKYDQLPAEYVDSWIHGPARSPLIVPVAWSKYGIHMLTNAVKVFNSRKIHVHKSFIKLHAALHGATALEYKLQKQNSPNNDSLDSLLLALLRVSWK